MDADGTVEFCVERRIPDQRRGRPRAPGLQYPADVFEWSFDMLHGIRCHMADTGSSGSSGEPPEIVDFGFLLGMKDLQAAVADAVMSGRALPHPLLVRVELAHRIEVAEARRRVLQLRLAPSNAEGIALAFRDELDTIFALTGNAAGRNRVYV